MQVLTYPVDKKLMQNQNVHQTVIWIVICNSSWKLTIVKIYYLFARVMANYFCFSQRNFLPRIRDVSAHQARIVIMIEGIHLSGILEGGTLVHFIGCTVDGLGLCAEVKNLLLVRLYCVERHFVVFQSNMAMLCTFLDGCIAKSL